MKTSLRFLGMNHAVAAGVLLCGVAGCGDDAAERARERAQAQVSSLADDLDGRTTETGVYIRVKDADIKETDPWGTKLKVGYSQGGVAEMFTVRSAGPDREFNTTDDVIARRVSANLNGVGEGIKKNAEETASNAAKGAVKGVVQGVKESIAESAARKKKKQQDNDAAETVPEK